MWIRNISPLGALDVPALGLVVQAGDVVDVADEAVATSLLEQADNWQAAPADDDNEEGGRS